MACNKVALVVSSISKHCVCPNPLLPSEELSRRGHMGHSAFCREGGAWDYIGEERVGTYKYIQEGLGRKPSKGYYYIYPPYSLPYMYDQIKRVM